MPPSTARKPKPAPPSPKPAICVEPALGPTKRAVLKGLRAFNTRAGGRRNASEFAISLRVGDTLVGGLVARVRRGACAIQLMWIDDAYRGRGHGAEIVGLLEAEARARGAHLVHVDTLSFQAPGFYEKQGYVEFGRLALSPPGTFHIFLQKPL